MQSPNTRSNQNTDFILYVSKDLRRINQVSHSKTRTVKKHRVLFSLWAIASTAVNRVTVSTGDNYKCCLHIAAAPFAVEALVLRGLWGEMRERRALEEESGEFGKLSPQSGVMG